MKKNNIFLEIILLVMFWSVATHSWALCRQVQWDTGVYRTDSGTVGNSFAITQTEDNNAASLQIGNIHLMDIAIQPLGTVLAQVSVPPTAYKVRNANPESLLWACDIATTDISIIRFLTSVNGDDRVGGRHKVSTVNAGGQDNVYYTWFKGVGIRQVMGDTTLAPQWTELPIQYEVGTGGTTAGKDICRNGYYCIRLKHLPVLRFELIRVGGIPPRNLSDQNDYCDSVTTGSDTGLGNSGIYNCNQPISYVALGHTGTAHIGGRKNNYDADSILDFPHDTIGITHAKSDTTFRSWWGDNGFGYTLFKSVNLINDSVTCKLNTVTPTVNFGSTTTGYLNNNNVVSQNFYIDVDCNDGVLSGNKSGTTSGKVAIGIQPSQQAYDAVKNNLFLSLYNGDTFKSVKALLDNNYGATGVAQNVGIYIKYQGASSYLNLLGQPGATGTLADRNYNDGPVGHSTFAESCGTNYNQKCYLGITFPMGEEAGWYPILNSGHYTSVGTPLTSYTTYRINYTADLKHITGAPPVTAGTVNSTAYVVVKIQ